MPLRIFICLAFMPDDAFSSGPSRNDELDALRSEVRSLRSRIQELESGGASVPDSMLFDTSFLKRSFAVFGHHFVANLIISILIGLPIVLLLVLFGVLAA